MWVVSQDRVAARPVQLGLRTLDAVDVAQGLQPGERVSILSNTLVEWVLADLGVTNLESVESIVPTYLWRHRPHGQFQPPHVDEASRVDA